jgi:uncharacterized membrane protein YqjE
MSLVINFGTAIITFVIGLLLILGVIYPGNLDSAKSMFAVVLMVYGVYRFVTTYSKIKQAKLEENRDKINKEREKLLKQ